MNRTQVMYAARLVVTVLVLVVSAFYLYSIRDKLEVVQNIALGELLALALLVFLFIALAGLVFALLVRLVGIRLTLFETVGLSVITSFGNYLGPTRAGAVMKAVYLKSARQLPYTRFASVLLAASFLGFLMTGTAGFVGLLVTWRAYQRPPILLLLICAGLIVVFLLPFLFRLPPLKSKYRVVGWFISALEGFHTISRERFGLVLICITLLAQYLLSALIFVLTFRALGMEIDFSTAFVIGVFNSISNFFSVTPNNIGVQEAVSGYITALAGQDFASGVLATGVIRVLHVGLSFGLGPLFAHGLLRGKTLK